MISLPTIAAPPAGANAVAINKLIDALEEHDDVKEIFSIRMTHLNSYEKTGEQLVFPRRKK